jgi:FeS assembly protein IscX
MKWQDARDIAISLADKYPSTDVLSVSFPALRKMVVELDGFTDNPNGCNEKILENLQMLWLDEQS